MQAKPTCEPNLSATGSQEQPRAASAEQQPKQQPAYEAGEPELAGENVSTREPITALALLSRISVHVVLRKASSAAQV